MNALTNIEDLPRTAAQRARPHQTGKSLRLTLAFHGLTIFVAILAAVSAGVTLSQPF